MLRDVKPAEDRVHQAYEEELQEYKNSKELQKKIYEEAFRMFAICYNQGLKAA